MYKAALLLIPAIGLISCADTYPEITNDAGNIPTPDESTNDTFFNAESLPANGLNGSLGPNDTLDIYSLGSSGFNTHFNGTLKFTLTNLNGNADIEVYDSNLNLISWSNSSAIENEEIIIWYDATRNSDLNTMGLHFVKVIAVDPDAMNYTLSYNFE